MYSRTTFRRPTEVIRSSLAPTLKSYSVPVTSLELPPTLVLVAGLRSGALVSSIKSKLDPKKQFDVRFWSCDPKAEGKDCFPRAAQKSMRSGNSPPPLPEREGRGTNDPARKVVEGRNLSGEVGKP